MWAGYSCVPSSVTGRCECLLCYHLQLMALRKAQAVRLCPEQKKEKIFHCSSWTLPSAEGDHLERHHLSAARVCQPMHVWFMWKGREGVRDYRTRYRLLTGV